jgi:hypothetical protein
MSELNKSGSIDLKNLILDLEGAEKGSQIFTKNPSGVNMSQQMQYDNTQAITSEISKLRVLMEKHRGFHLQCSQLDTIMKRYDHTQK